MQIMFGTILCVLLKGLILTKATFTSKDYIISNSLQKENVSMYPDLNFTQDISMSEKSDHHILNFKSDRSHSDSTVRNKREVDEVPLANISIIPEIGSRLNKPTSFRAFVQFDRIQFTEKVNDIFVTLRWNQPEFTDEIIGYTVKCFFIENVKEIQICDDKNITTTKLEHTVHNLTFNTTYYFQVRAHTKIVAGPYTDLINVSTTHENPIPKLLLTTYNDIRIWDVDSNTITDCVTSYTNILDVAYSIQEHRIYWNTGYDLMILKINENNVIKMASFDQHLNGLWIDWVARNLYFNSISYEDSYSYIIKFDLTMWENGIIKFDKILETRDAVRYINILPSMGILYRTSYNPWNKQYDIMKYDLNGKNEQIVQINSSNMFCPLHIDSFNHMIIPDMNNEKPLIYWLSEHYIIMTDINVSMCNTILHKKNISDNMEFQFITIDNTYIYILATDHSFHYNLYVLKKKYAILESVNADEYVEKIISRIGNYFFGIYAFFDKSLQPYPPMRCLTPDKKIYSFEKVAVTVNSIIVNLPEPVVKSGCKQYNLPTTIYTISVSCLGNNLYKCEKFNEQTYERYYKIQNLTPFTEYKLKFTLSNFYFDQLSINPFNSKVILIKTNPCQLNAPENISVLALTPTKAVVHWMPMLKKVNCRAVTYEVLWKSITLVNDTQKSEFINMPKRTTDGRFFTKIRLSLPVQNYSISLRVYPSNVRDFYEKNEIVYIYSEPNNITLKEVTANSMVISWIPSINLTISSAIQYKDVATEKWQTTDYNETKMNYNKEETYPIGNLQSGTLYVFRVILRYPEDEEDFIWPTDDRFNFSTLGDISSTSGTLTKIYYLPLLSFIVIATIICVCYIYRLYRQRRGNNEQFLSSTMTNIELATLHEIPCRNTQFNMIYSPMLHYNPDECAITKIARKQITFTKLLGSGAFGMVYQGNVKNLERSGTEISVAIKMLRTDASSHEKTEFLKEAKFMNHFRHKNVLRLLAVCLDGDSPLLVLELMETGDLLKYLRDCRNLQASDSYALRLQDLLAMCEDVARGCCYLEELRFVHRDLACRNCLVSSKNRETRVIKIGDFGLARHIYKNDYYRVKEERLLPVRWMAPESLIIGTFTSQSDVWSFGILIWEITSLGEQPYMGKTNEEVIKYVRDGDRLPMTLNCPSSLYQLMLRCWSTADARPNFEFCLKNIIALRKNIEDASLSPVDIL